jgi:hypothetical protein
MKNNLFRLPLICLMLLLAVNNLVAQKTVVKKKPAATVPATAVIKTFDNGIKLKIKGLTVKEAYLIFEDETKVPADNTVELNQKVNLRIVLDKGFKEENGKVFIGATEKIVLSNGFTVLDSKDLFAAYDETGVSPEDAKFISLKAVMTELDDKKKYVKVSFKVWDKKSTANEITGYYIMHIK